MNRWEARVARVQAELAPARAMLGDWIGEGVAHGEPVTASMRVRAILGDSVIEVSERVGDHEDVSFYRFDVDTGQLRALHLMAGAMVTDVPIELVPGGLVWVTLPGEPSVEWRLEGEELVCDVLWPGDTKPEVRVRYRRAG